MTTRTREDLVADMERFATPGLDYLTKMIDRVKAGDPTPGVPT